MKFKYGSLIFIPLAMLLFAGSICAYDFQRVVDSHIEPGYKNLEKTTAVLLDLSRNYCDKPSSQLLANFKDDYVAAFSAWQAVQHIRFGPIQYLNREHRIQLWPDKRGSVGKHLARLLNGTDITAADFDIAQKSVAVQGFGALERLIYGETSFDNRRCKLAVAITENLSAIASHVYIDWMRSESPYSQFFISPGDDNYIYESENELASQLLNAIYSQLELMTTKKLDRPLGGTLTQANGKRSEAWRSSTSLLALDNNLVAIKQCYELVYSNVLSVELSAEINDAFARSEKALKNIDRPLMRAVASESDRVKVQEFRNALSVLKRLFAQPLAAELDLILGFNSLDGD